MRHLILPAFLVLSAAAQAQPATPRRPAQPVACAANQLAFPALIGQPQAAVEAALRAMPGIASLRSGGPTAPMTMDYREDRVTITVVDGRVTRIVCG